MTITFSKIAEIFSNAIKNSTRDVEYEDAILQLVYLLVGENKIIWDLEDSARMVEFGDKHVAGSKRDIDTHNQKRNDLIREIDSAIYKLLNVSRGAKEFFIAKVLE